MDFHSSRGEREGTEGTTNESLKMTIHGGFPISMIARFLPISWSSSRRGPGCAASLDDRLYTDNHALGATSSSICRGWKVVATASHLESLQSLNDEEEDQDMERMAGEEWRDEFLFRLRTLSPSYVPNSARKRAPAQNATVTPHVSSPYDYINHVFKRP
jgi:hypothetical protein